MYYVYVRNYDLVGQVGTEEESQRVGEQQQEYSKKQQHQELLQQQQQLELQASSTVIETSMIMQLHIQYPFVHII